MTECPEPESIGRRDQAAIERAQAFAAAVILSACVL
jgi:hypothetical protein